MYSFNLVNFFLHLIYSSNGEQKNKKALPPCKGQTSYLSM